MIKQLTLFTALTLLIISCKTNPPTEPETPVSTFGKVIVNSNIAGSKIFLDGEFTGKLTPDTLTLGEGDYLIKVVKEEATKLVLIEDFANVSCIPCVQSNKILESLSNIKFGRNKLVVIKFPTNFPSPNDPFYLANKIDCDSRIGYYNIFFAPNTVTDGIERPISTDSLDVISKVEARMDSLPRFDLSVTASASGGNYFITVNVKVIEKYFPSSQTLNIKAGDSKTLDFNLNLDNSTINYSDLVLHTVVTETDIEFSTPPGSNGETKFFDVMRKMLPTNGGQDLTSLEQSSEEAYQFQVPIGSGWEVNNLNVVTYVQNKVTKEIFQSSSTFE
ncbi:MAG: PEGA domain-containing protein [Ignavibacteriaceae bacterium]